MGCFESAPRAAQTYATALLAVSSFLLVFNMTMDWTPWTLVVQGLSEVVDFWGLQSSPSW